MERASASEIAGDMVAVAGEPVGVGLHENRVTGVAHHAGKGGLEAAQSHNEAAPVRRLDDDEAPREGLVQLEVLQEDQNLAFLHQGYQTPVIRGLPEWPQDEVDLATVRVDVEPVGDWQGLFADDAELTRRAVCGVCDKGPVALDPRQLRIVGHTLRRIRLLAIVPLDKLLKELLPEGQDFRPAPLPLLGAAAAARGLTGPIRLPALEANSRPWWVR